MKKVHSEMELLVRILQCFVHRHGFDTVHDLIGASTYKWPRFFKLMRDHKMSAVVEVAFRMIRMDKSHPRVFRKLMQLRTLRKNRQEILDLERIRLGALFEEREIPFVPYKGSDFAEMFYPDPRLRNSIDLDLAILQSHLRDAAQLLFSAGYEEHKNTTDFDNKIEKSRAHAIDYSFVKRNEDGQIYSNVELHWQPGHPVLKIGPTFEQIWDQRIAVEPETSSYIFSFDPIHQAMIMILHHGLIDTWGKLRHLLDLHCIQTRLTQEEMHLLEILLGQYKMVKAFRVGQDVLQQILSYQGQQDGKQTDSATGLTLDLMCNGLSGNWSDQKKKLWHHWRMRETLQEKLQLSVALSRFALSGK